MNLEPLEVHEDDRGTLVEAFHFPQDGQVHYSLSTPHAVRGNHYHLRKIEQFVIIFGDAEMQVKNRETGDVIKVTLSGTKPMRVTVVPNHTHTIIAGDQGCVLAAWANEPYDPKDSDTYPEEI